MAKDSNSDQSNEVFVDGLLKSIERFQFLAEQNKRNTGEMLRLRQYMTATVNLLNEEGREVWETLVDSVLEEADASVATLTEAIKKILQINYPDFMSVAKVRDELVATGFDFSSYKSNELASVSTTMRRIQPELETRDNAGTAEYRLAPTGFPILPKSAAQIREVVDSMIENKIKQSEQATRGKVNERVHRSRGASSSFDSGWIRGYGAVPKKDK